MKLKSMYFLILIGIIPHLSITGEIKSLQELSFDSLLKTLDADCNLIECSDPENYLKNFKAIFTSLPDNPLKLKLELIKKSLSNAFNHLINKKDALLKFMADKENSDFNKEITELIKKSNLPIDLSFAFKLEMPILKYADYRRYSDFFPSFRALYIQNSNILILYIKKYIFWFLINPIEKKIVLLGTTDTDDLITDIAGDKKSVAIVTQAYDIETEEKFPDVVSPREFIQYTLSNSHPFIQHARTQNLPPRQRPVDELPDNTQRLLMLEKILVVYNQDTALIAVRDPNTGLVNIEQPVLNFNNSATEKAILLIIPTESHKRLVLINYNYQNKSKTLEVFVYNIAQEPIRLEDQFNIEPLGKEYDFLLMDGVEWKDFIPRINDKLKQKIEEQLEFDEEKEIYQEGALFNFYYQQKNEFPIQSEKCEGGPDTVFVPLKGTLPAAPYLVKVIQFIKEENISFFDAIQKVLSPTSS